MRGGLIRYFRIKLISKIYSRVKNIYTHQTSGIIHCEGGLISCAPGNVYRNVNRVLRGRALVRGHQPDRYRQGFILLSSAHLDTSIRSLSWSFLIYNGHGLQMKREVVFFVLFLSLFKTFWIKFWINLRVFDNVHSKIESLQFYFIKHSLNKLL